MSGGETTEENCALLKWYNHKHLESSPKEKKEEYNWNLKEYHAFADLIYAKKQVELWNKEVEKYQKKYDEVRKQRKEWRLNKEEKER